MKVKELIEQLTKVYTEHGDLDVRIDVVELTKYLGIRAIVGLNKNEGGDNIKHIHLVGATSSDSFLEYMDIMQKKGNIK